MSKHSTVHTFYEVFDSHDSYNWKECEYFKTEKGAVLWAKHLSRKNPNIDYAVIKTNTEVIWMKPLKQNE